MKGIIGGASVFWNSFVSHIYGLYTRLEESSKQRSRISFERTRAECKKRLSRRKTAAYLGVRSGQFVRKVRVSRRGEAPFMNASPPCAHAGTGGAPAAGDPLLLIQSGKCLHLSDRPWTRSSERYKNNLAISVMGMKSLREPAARDRKPKR